MRLTSSSNSERWLHCPFRRHSSRQWSQRGLHAVESDVAETLTVIVLSQVRLDLVEFNLYNNFPESSKCENLLRYLEACQSVGTTETLGMGRLV